MRANPFSTRCACIIALSCFLGIVMRPAQAQEASGGLSLSVVIVENDFGHGSGFVVDARGLILTNQHVTNGMQWIAVRFDRGKRFNASVVYEDKAADVAVIQFNPAAFTEFRVIPLADPFRGPI